MVDFFELFSDMLDLSDDSAVDLLFFLRLDEFGYDALEFSATAASELCEYSLYSNENELLDGLTVL